MKFVGTIEQASIEPAEDRPKVHLHLTCELEAKDLADLMYMMGQHCEDSKQWPMSIGEDDDCLASGVARG